MKQKLIAKTLIEDLNFIVDNLAKSDITREINGLGLDRKGLELSGLIVSPYYYGKIVGWGTKENLFLNSKIKEERIKAYHNALSSKTPLLFLSKVFDGKLKKEIIDLASSMQIPVVTYEANISSLQPILNNYLSEHKAEIKTIHASFVIIHGLGVIIKGASGIGKSEAVLELVHNNHVFVSDDTVNLYKIGLDIYGRPATITKDFLEARGIGLVNIPYIYGTRLTADKAKVDLIIELVSPQKMNHLDRLGNQNLSEVLHGREIPKIQIPAGAGRSIASLIEAATNVFLAKKEGFEPVEEMQKRRE